MGEDRVASAAPPPAEVGGFDASGLAETVDRARKLLDEGDVIAARMLASGAYDQAKAAAQFAERFGAAERLVGKARRLQGDALLIEARAKIRLAAEYDAAQAAGLVRKPGQRGKAIPDGNGISTPTAEDVGLSPKDVLESRRLRDAERRAPGIVERAIAARLAAGLEPSRANLRAAVGTASATAAERGNNLYETPPEAMKTLLSFCRFGRTVWEPACGKGAIARQLEDAGYAVELSDLVDYSTADRHGELQRVEDFLATAPRCNDPDRPDIVTNPPYGAALNAFVAHALSAHRPRRMALLLNLNFLCGFDDADRNYAMDENPPARIYVFTRRLPMMHRDGWDGPEASSRMNTAWFVWELRGEGVDSYAGPTEILRVDWKTFENAVPVGPAAALDPPPFTGEGDHAQHGGGGGHPEAPSSGFAAPLGPSGHSPRERGEITGAALAWVQPHEGGRILAMSGALEVGAIFLDNDKAACRWAFFVGAISSPHVSARSVDAAKRALTKRWNEWLARAGLGAAE